ncbi:Protein kinase-like (PK-like) [Glarea lozoyensis ATCC 20868]|uniref:Protein kinase-like (PK-like) n=1 Tax=Glarea lozoyensis (strain ATCC 20868 / MF5171) TaxID=1116229 RepID=S3DLW7_GLAL2|nr:Protein kinase-like (PK-like) [Glarea lozoyensis ATCC 20868]EPE33061.1 Protein kinase-like (PK-like) [Glarea lozoyensis ATCC 20868]
MAVSPLIVPGSGERGPHSKSKLSAASSGNGTPSTTLGSNSLKDVAEQMNEEEKDKYVKGKKVGEGTYANVYIGHHKSDPSNLVAIKKIKVQQEYKEGMAPDAIRELKHLQELSHPNIISLLSVFSSKDQNLNLVLEYLPLGDLEVLIKDIENIHYGAADIKAWMGMLSRAIWFCHENFVLHRDIKPNNLLIAADGEIKLADFGLARSFADPYRVMTSNVITRWYRPPELLFGAKHYSGAVDIWSVGLVFAELVIRNPYLPGDTEIDQIAKICAGIGTPTEENWAGVSKLPEYTVPSPTTPVHGPEHYLGMFGTAGPDGVDLLMKMLILDPRRRITAREVLEHRWWRGEPRATRNEDLPKKGPGSGLSRLGATESKRPGMVEGVARRLDFGA